MKSGIYIYIYIAVMAFTTWCMRVIPSIIMKKPLTNRFFKSFLYYVPYVTLSIMTFPAIIEATDMPLAGAGALLVGILAAWYGVSLFGVASACCITVLLLEYML